MSGRQGTKLYDSNGYFVARVIGEVADSCDILEYDGARYVRHNATQFDEAISRRLGASEASRL